KLSAHASGRVDGECVVRMPRLPQNSGWLPASDDAADYEDEFDDPREFGDADKWVVCSRWVSQAISEEDQRTESCEVRQDRSDSPAVSGGISLPLHADDAGQWISRCAPDIKHFVANSQS